MRVERRGILVALVVVALIVSAAACGDDDGGGGTGTTDAIVFGEGTIPPAVPDNFPVPSNAVVGSTLIDKVNNRSEFRLTIPADATSAVQFFEVGLVNQGYVINSSEGNAAEWTIAFSDGELKGTVFSTPQGQAVTTVVVSINRS